jgi:pyridoxamine 5'-phosphate oxidase
MQENPFILFQQWLDEANSHPAINEPTAMSLASCSNNVPSVRIVLLKGFDERGLVFYSNSSSQKGREITENPNVSVCFYWMPLEKQVRINGVLSEVSAGEADSYFATRQRERQIGAWASKQSEIMIDRSEFDERLSHMNERFAGSPIPRPPYWSGWRIMPNQFEFWQQQAHRWHHRERFIRGEAQGEWHKQLLYP